MSSVGLGLVAATVGSQGKKRRGCSGGIGTGADSRAALVGMVSSGRRMASLEGGHHDR
jgi:hypothetical protein